jgi:hypothetical protein
VAHIGIVRASNRLVPEPPFTGKKTYWGKRKLARDRKARQRRRRQMTDELWIKLVTACEKFEDAPSYGTAVALLEVKTVR